MLLRKYWRVYRPYDLFFPGLTAGKPIAARNIQQVFQVRLSNLNCACAFRPKAKTSHAHSNPFNVWLYKPGIYFQAYKTIGIIEIA